MMYFIAISFTFAYQQLNMPLETYTSLARISMLTAILFHFPELYNLLSQILFQENCDIAKDVA